MLYEYGIFSTYFSDNQVPHSFIYKTNGSSMSFTVPYSPDNQRIRGLNVSFVQANSDLIKATGVTATKINNMTKNLTWAYIYQWKIKERNGDIVLMSHWIFENNELEAGDEVYVSIGESKKYCINIKECGIDLVYDEYNNKLTDPLDCYKSWEHIIGGDLSHLRCTDGSYILTSELWKPDSDYLTSMDVYLSLFNKPPQFEDEQSWEQTVLD